MSLGGSVSNALDTAVDNSADSGVFYSLSAGNNGVDACNSSPACTGQGTNGILSGTSMAAPPRRQRRRAVSVVEHGRHSS